MLKSMYSGVSGMKANQTKMDVVGNNVANVGTTSFKKSTTRFSDALYQTSIYASAPSGGLGGVNPGQIGIGTTVSGVFKNMLQGSIQPTGRPTDIAIDGDGFFVINMNGSEAYTRDGSFSLDANGDLVTADGYYVKEATKNGEKINIPSTADNAKGEKKNVISFNISKDGKISYVLDDGSKVEKQKLQIAVFPNPEGLEQLAGNLYGSTGNSGIKTDNTDDAKKISYGQINQGAIEMSNVDLSEEFTEMIVTTRAFQAASKVITTSDELLQEIINLKR